jgi:hypothetical protein
VTAGHWWPTSNQMLLVTYTYLADAIAGVEIILHIYLRRGTADKLHLLLQSRATITLQIDQYACHYKWHVGSPPKWYPIPYLVHYFWPGIGLCSALLLTRDIGLCSALLLTRDIGLCSALLSTRDIGLWSTVVHYKGLWSTIVYYIGLWSTIVHHIGLWSTIVHYIGLWSTIVHYKGLWSTIVHCIGLWSTIVYYIGLWSTIVHYTGLWSTVVHYIGNWVQQKWCPLFSDWDWLDV